MPGYQSLGIAALVIWLLPPLSFGSGATAAGQASEGLSLSVGMDYSSGDYGHAKETDILYLPLSLTYDRFPWRAAVNLSYLRIAGPGGVIGAGDGGVIVGGGGSGAGGGGNRKAGTRNKRGIRAEQGMGDVIAGLSYALDTLWDLPVALDLTGKVKLATADPEKELGTGENDYLLQLDLADDYGRFSPFATLGYRVMGDPPDLDLEDVWLGSVGLEYRLNPALHGGAVFDYRQATTVGAEPMQELTVYLRWEIDSSWALNGYGVAGFSDGSPAGAVGLQFSFEPSF